MKRKLAVVCMVLLLGAACASSTRIQTNPEGARVYINGEHVGATPYLHTDRNTWLQKSQLTLKKEGYRDLDTWLQRDGNFNCLGAIWYTLWIWDYKDTHQYDLEPVRK